MIKKIILGLCFLAFLTPQTVFADSAPISKKEIKEVEQFFNTYIYSANNYKDDLIDKYKNQSKNILIITLFIHVLLLIIFNTLL